MTPHFTLEELTRSDTARRLRIDNTPPDAVLPALQRLAELLERVREVLGHPVVVTSAYRCSELNHAVGSRRTSDHISGQAADIVCPGYGPAGDVARALAPQVGRLGIGQIALERVGGKEWVHLSTRTPERVANRVITIDDSGVRLGIQEA